MSDVSEFMSHQGPIGRAINEAANGVKTVALDDVHKAVATALTSFGDFIEAGVEEVKLAVTTELNKL